jgi:hypothetical protein
MNCRDCGGRVRFRSSIVRRIRRLSDLFDSCFLNRGLHFLDMRPAPLSKTPGSPDFRGKKKAALGRLAVRARWFRQSSSAGRTASFTSPATLCAAPFALSILPSVCNFLSPVTARHSCAWREPGFSSVEEEQPARRLRASFCLGRNVCVSEIANFALSNQICGHSPEVRDLRFHKMVPSLAEISFLMGQVNGASMMRDGTASQWPPLFSRIT